MTKPGPLFSAKSRVNAVVIAAGSERTADKERQFANETDQRAADLDARIASRCEGDGH